MDPVRNCELSVSHFDTTYLRIYLLRSFFIEKKKGVKDNPSSESGATLLERPSIGLSVAGVR